MKDILLMILEKVKSESLTTDEAAIIIEALYKKGKSDTNVYTDHETWDDVSSQFQDQFKGFVSKVAEINKEVDWEKVGDDVKQTIKNVINSWSGK